MQPSAPGLRSAEALASLRAVTIAPVAGIVHVTGDNARGPIVG